VPTHGDVPCAPPDACGSNDEAAAEISLVRHYDENDIVLSHCNSRLKSKEGKIAEAALEALNILNGAIDPVVRTQEPLKC